MRPPQRAILSRSDNISRQALVNAGLSGGKGGTRKNRNAEKKTRPPWRRQRPTKDALAKAGGLFQVLLVGRFMLPLLFAGPGAKASEK